MPQNFGECRECRKSVVDLIKTISDLATALELIAEGEIDSGGNRRNHQDATTIARKALGLNK